jgi:ubiquinone/menaquinone biosynthesis C-methylase UbiE
MDPLADWSWSAPETVAGFAKSSPNQVLLDTAAGELGNAAGRHLLDIGCGAGRNAVPLARMGWKVLGTDLSRPMLAAARDRIPGEVDGGRLWLARAPMDQLPVATRSIDFLVAHGIWNLAPDAATFRAAVAEAGRVARPGAALFVFTFSRHTLPAAAQPVPGEPFVYTQFSGQPQCFLTEEQLRQELAAEGFDREPGVPIREYNRPRPDAIVRGSGPVIYEGLFRRARHA